ncbi:cytochrome c oxidase assembly protein [Catenovulum sp. SM1970]|uniref:cytochrome c oxidase assembly protein n=1 Tax=Marinifaba aquimaris TaxID=2741323 RepID=UPI00157423FA|nr:cytochrome c oxidase assembly protein [Marinifaba aquimaris]NTS76526.1 cytochrome c oxidase assembly protein [Marinifaba aquimaris]
MTRANLVLLRKLVLVVFGMFLFGFALVPLYDTFCEITGINGRIIVKAEDSDADKVVSDRRVKIQFLVKTDAKNEFDFKSNQKFIEVKIGELSEVSFEVKNKTSSLQLAQAVPSVSPGTASLYLNKTECFCFSQQILQANETVVYPMRFFIDEDLPEDISLLTLSYTLYQAQSVQASYSKSELDKGAS